MFPEGRVHKRYETCNGCGFTSLWMAVCAVRWAQILVSNNFIWSRLRPSWTTTVRLLNQHKKIC